MSAVHIHSVTLVSPNNMLHSKPIPNPHQDPTRINDIIDPKTYAVSSDKDTNASHCSKTTAPTMIRRPKDCRSSRWMMWTSTHWDSTSVWERCCRRRRCILWSIPLHSVMANAPKPCSGMQSLSMLEVPLSGQRIVRHRGEIIMSTMIADVFENQTSVQWVNYTADVAPKCPLRLRAISPLQTTFVYTLCG